MTTAVYPGTFDPFTLGHLDVLKRAARLFDRVILAVAESRKKGTLFSLQERVALAEAACRAETGLENVEVQGFSGLLCDFARARGVTVSVRGARAVSDFEYEGQTVMLAPASGFYTTPGLGRDEVRLAYVLKKEDLAKALEVLRKALEAYPGRTN